VRGERLQHDRQPSPSVHPPRRRRRHPVALVAGTSVGSPAARGVPPNTWAVRA